MLLLTIAVIIGILAFALLRTRQPVACRPDLPKKETEAGDNQGSMVTGLMLSYLVSNFLIDSHQYNEWRGLSTAELSAALNAAGIMTEADFAGLSDQLTAGVELDEAQNQYDFKDMTKEYPGSEE